VDIGQWEEKAPEYLLGDLVQKEALLEDVIQSLNYWTRLCVTILYN